MQHRFTQIYATNEWGSGSGEGSAPIHTRGYVRFLRRFLRVHRIRSVVDLGCGDWQFSRLMDWNGIQYRGLDIVPDVIERNHRMFSAPNVQFHHFSTTWSELPGADLLIAKDLFQHWSNSTILGFLPVLSSYRLSLVTNCVDPTGRPTKNEVREQSLTSDPPVRPSDGVNCSPSEGQNDTDTDPQVRPPSLTGAA